MTACTCEWIDQTSVYHEFRINTYMQNIDCKSDLLSSTMTQVKVCKQHKGNQTRLFIYCFFLTSFHVQDTSRKLSLLSNIFKKSSKYCRRVFICTMYYFASISIFFSLYAHVLSNTTTKALIAHIKIDLLKKQKKQQQNIAVCPRRKEGFSVVTKIKSWTQQAKPQINPPSTTSSIPPFTSWVQKVWTFTQSFIVHFHFSSSTIFDSFMYLSIRWRGTPRCMSS